MKALARVFSLLVFLALLGAVAAVVYLRPAPAPQGGPLAPITRILVDKSDRKMVVYNGETALRSYTIALGFSPVGDKERQGDGRTPEGVFRIDRKNPGSAFSLSLGLDYPQAEDRARAAKGGYDPGGDIMIHGQPNNFPEGMMAKGDWTAGCIALPNSAMREVFAATEVGAVVDVRP
jgi:murein L,D-transpeptidase YafK